MVDPDRRSSLAAMQLVREFLAGPQDLSLADGTAPSRTIWQAFGGTTCTLYSFRWTRALRPGRFVLNLLTGHGLPSLMAQVARPWSAAIDAIATRTGWTPFRQSAPRTWSETLTAETLLACLARFSRDRALRPDYDERSVRWLLDVLQRSAPLRRVLLRDDGGEVLGWYLYYPRRGGVSEVVQVGAVPRGRREVLEHLFFDAWSHGALAVSGQLDPRHLEALSTARCVLDNGGFWTLAHARRPAVLEAIARGDAFLTRLESEGWMRLAF